MIFGNNAPKFWEKGLPVIPLHGKAPIISKWQRFSDVMPTPEEQKQMLATYSNCNMGLPLGQQSRCIALDIDTDSKAELELIDSLVPQSPWVRVGKKGKVMMYRYTGENTFRIKDANGRTICELLANKVQVVLPPSIHPDTHAPYLENCPLLDVVDNLPTLPKNIEEVLRNAFVDKLGIKLSSKGWTKTVDFVSSGSRDVKMTSVAGLYANSVLRGEITLREAIDIFRAWCFTQTEKVAGDDVDVEKGVRNLVKFLLRNLENKKRPLPKGWDKDLTSEERKSLGLTISEEQNVAWDFDKLRTYIKEKCPDVVEKGIDSNELEFILEQIARSTDLTSIELERCYNHIASLDPQVKVPAIRKRVHELKVMNEGIEGINHTEIACAVLRDIDMYIDGEGTADFDNIRWFNGGFWLWGGSNWEPMAEREILQRISKEYGSYPAASKASDHKGILAVMKSLVKEGLGGDKENAGVNFANGWVDTLGVMHPHDKRYGCTYTMPFCYKPASNFSNPEGNLVPGAPLFSRFLTMVWGEGQEIKALRQVMAATMFGMGSSFARAVLLFGIGQSGKTQLLHIMEGILPDDAVSYVSPYDFADKFKPAVLANSLMNVCGELQANGNIPSAQFKQVIDGTVMQGQLKGQQVFNFKPKAMHWFASNHLPHSKDTTEGFNRRWIIFPFTKMIRAQDKIRDFGELVIAQEREAITAWVVDEMKTLANKPDFDLPLSHFKLINEMCAENDSLFSYMVSKNGPTKGNDDDIIETERLYENYRAFCYSSAGTKPIGLRKFYARVKELGIILGYKVDDVVRGLRLDGVGQRLGR